MPGRTQGPQNVCEDGRPESRRQEVSETEAHARDMVPEEERKRRAAEKDE